MAMQLLHSVYEDGDFNFHCWLFRFPKLVPIVLLNPVISRDKLSTSITDTAVAYFRICHKPKVFIPQVLQLHGLLTIMFTKAFHRN